MRWMLAAFLALGASWALAQDARFAAADADGDGAVSLAEAQALFPDMTEEDFAAADGDGDGALSEDEFLAMLG
jgi:hypothetical protein